MRTRFMLTLFIFLLSLSAVLAQTDNCPSLVEKALADMTANCGAMERNSACYGYNRVDVTFTQAVEEGAFSLPADRTQLATLDIIKTAPLDIAQTRWGIAVLNVQANVPNSLPGQAVTFLLLGDVEIENAVPPDQAFQGSEPIAVKTAVASNLRSLPNANANLVGSTPADTELSADGLSADGEWARVLFETGPAWINRALLTPDVDLSGLAVISEENRSPMQAFFFTTGASEPDCSEVPPSTLVVQGPDNVKVDITANGADIRIGSTIALQSTPDGQLQLFVLSGSVQLGNLNVPAGFTIILPLSPDGKTPAGSWTGLRPMTPDEIESFRLLESFEGDFMHYPIILPTTEDIQRALAALGGGGGTNGSPTSNLPACQGLQITSPIGGVPFGGVDFYWDAPASGADSYTASVFGTDGSVIQSQTTGGTQATFDTGSFINGPLFYWQVDATLADGTVCSTGQVTILRAINPNEPTPIVGPYCGDAICTDGERQAGCFSDCPTPVCGDGYYENPAESCSGMYQCDAENGGC